MIRFRSLLLSAALLAVTTVLVASPADAATKKKKKAAAAAAATSDDSSVPTAPPANQDTSTKKLEEKLKKAEATDQDTQTVLAPVRMDTQGTLTKDDKAEKARQLEVDRIKKILAKSTIRDPSIRADLYFQLAEAYWQSSRYTLQFLEMPPFNKAADAWNSCTQHKGKKACGPEPRPNTLASEAKRAEAVKIYNTLTQQFKSYARLDEVWFLVGYNKMDLANQPGITKPKKDALVKEARAAFANIITNYPRSKLVCDANVELGNYFFDTNQLAPARHAFEEGLKCPKTGTYAKYKLAWCDYNAGDYKLAISRFKEVISTSDKASKEGNNLRLKTEALRDLVLSFQKAGELETAIDYYKREVGVSSARKYIVNLAGKYFDAGGYDYSSRTYRNYLIKAYSTDSSAPEWQTKIVLAYDKMGNRPQVRKEIEALVSGYGPTSSWARAQKDKSALERAINLTEEALYNLVTDYHQEAIKTKSVATYKLARDIYKEYLDHFPRSERAYAMRFYYAEILYALEDYQAALTQYNLVIDDKGKLQDYRKISAKDQLLAAEKLVDIDDGTYKKEIQDDTQKIDEGKSKGGITATNIKAKVDKNKSESDLTAHEKQLVASCDRYLSIIPKADDEASVRLRGAVIYFFKAQYVEASTRFAYIIKNWPQDPSSADAAGLILEALEAKQEWAELNTRASEFAENTKLLEGTADKKKDLRKKLPVYIEGSAFKLAQIVNDKDKDYPKAAGLFRDFAKKYPQSKFTPIALYNSFIIYQNAKQLDQAVQVGELLLKNYPKADSDEWRTLPGEDAKKRDPILADLTFRLAKTYELTADFIGAEKYYEQYMKNFPSEKSVLDAQWNAALWYRGLGQYDKAIAAREKYIKMCASATRGKAVTRGKSKEKDTKAAATECYAEPDVFWEIAGLYEDQKLWVKDIKQINDYLMKYSKVIEPWKVLRAKYHQLLAFKAQGISKQVGVMAENIVSSCGHLSDSDKKEESSKLACAHSRFITLDPAFEEYQKLRFKSDKTLKADLSVFTDKKKKLSGEYLDVVKDGNGDWAIAALVRIAELPRLLAKAVRESPVPKILTADQKDMYKSAIEDKAVEIETPAIDLLQTAMNKSFELGIYNEWTLEAEKAMAEFKPDLFLEPKELPLHGTEFLFSAHTALSQGKAGSGGD